MGHSPHLVVVLALFLWSAFGAFCSPLPAADYPVQQWKRWDEGAGDRYPGKVWARFATPEEAGWSSAKLDEARKRYDKLDSAAALVVYDGGVLAEWGDVSRRYMCHSIRKSLLSALYGIHADADRIDLEKTLAELGIDDEPPLSNQEKQARVIDLLKARSGVYHTAAYETPRMKTDRPPRDSHAPGTYFWYNNWDFNVLGTIFERETGAKIFEEFDRCFAKPLGMQDYRVRDGYYHLERRRSIHPAYPFRMSARDLARLGLLFLRKGRWANRQILSEAWVQRSTASYFQPGDTTRISDYGYGYLWWPFIKGPFADLGMYSARGSGGHAIDVIPAANLVIVYRVDTFWDVSELGKDRKHAVDDTERFTLVDLILRARVGPPKPNPRLIDIEDPPRHPDAVELPDDTLPRYVGRYRLGPLALNVTREGRELLIGNPGMGRFGLVPLSPTRFVIEDVEAPVAFTLDEDGRPTTISIEFTPGKPLRGKPLARRK